MHRKQCFRDTCIEYAQLSLVYCSVHETRADQLVLHYSVAFFHHTSLAKREPKNTLQNDIFNVLSVPVWRTRPTKIACPKAHNTQSCALCTRKDVSVIFQCNFSRMFNDSTLAVKSKSCFTPWPILHDSEKHGEKHGFAVSCVSLHKGPRTKMYCSVIQLQAKSRIIHI